MSYSKGALSYMQNHHRILLRTPIPPFRLLSIQISKLTRSFLNSTEDNSNANLLA